jgi:error-prone DNA polymerase
VGTFQIESRAQIQSILQTKPDRLYDIVVQVALIRPGPIQANFVHPYTERRRGREPVRYAHPKLEPILRRTYGVPIFQEQAMAIAMALGGFSASEADELRRAMGHQRKLPRLHAALRKLRAACIANGVEEAVADEVVRDLLSFANYGFPESHAWSFALIGYATAWLKANHPTEFLLGLLNAWPMGFYPPATLVHDARRSGVTVVGPCLKVGQWDCTLEDGPALRVGWRHIRGLGEKARERLQQAREDGPFASIADVIRRAQLTRADALHLARSGAFEAFQPGRRKAAWEALRAAGDLLPLAPARVLPFEPRELEGEELVFLDYLATGICPHGHPMEFVRARLSDAGVGSSSDMQHHASGELIVVAGLVVARQHPETAKGTVFLLLEDETGYINVIINKEVFARYREVVKYSPFLVIEGRFEREDQVMNVIARRFRELRMGTSRIGYRSRDFH